MAINKMVCYKNFFDSYFFTRIMLKMINILVSLNYRRIAFFKCCLIFNNFKTLKRVQGDGLRVQGDDLRVRGDGFRNVGVFKSLNQL